jgi:mono/diheme cytochrome c family protein
MNRRWLEMVFPAALGLLVVTMGVFVLSMTGLLYDPLSTPSPPVTYGCGVTGGEEQILAADTTSSSPADPLTPPPSPSELAAIAAGDALFKNNCAQCHAINDVVVGPALSGIVGWRSVSWLIPWVKNSGKVIASGDEYAVKIYNEYQRQQMPSFQLSDEEIRQILAYITAEDQRRPVAAEAVARL